MKSFELFLFHITEALNQMQKDAVDEWEKPTSYVSDAVFAQHADADGRIRIPLQKAHPVIDHLTKNGYHVHDYQNGMCKDSYGRVTRIGKALEKTDASEETKKFFATDRSRTLPTDDDYHIVISRHPHDVAGMSTCQSWDSCMNLIGGVNNYYVPQEIKQGTHVAYLIKGKNENEPVARIALKPYHSENGDHTILRPEKSYGIDSAAFDKTVRDWSHEHFPMKDNTYKKNKNVYNDGSPETMMSDQHILDVFHGREKNFSRASFESSGNSKQIVNALRRTPLNDRLKALDDADNPLLYHVTTSIGKNHFRNYIKSKLNDPSKPRLHHLNNYMYNDKDITEDLLDHRIKNPDHKQFHINNEDFFTGHFEHTNDQINKRLKHIENNKKELERSFSYLSSLIRYNIGSYSERAKNLLLSDRYKERTQSNYFFEGVNNDSSMSKHLKDYLINNAHQFYPDTYPGYVLNEDSVENASEDEIDQMISHMNENTHTQFVAAMRNKLKNYNPERHDRLLYEKMKTRPATFYSQLVQLGEKTELKDLQAQMHHENVYPLSQLGLMRNHFVDRSLRNKAREIYDQATKLK